MANVELDELKDKQGLYVKQWITGLGFHIDKLNAWSGLPSRLGFHMDYINYLEVSGRSIALLDKWDNWFVKR